MKTNNKTNLYLECQLNDEELISCAKALAESIEKKNRTLDDILIFKAQRNAEIASFDATIARMSSMVHSEKEFRNVECDVIFDFQKGFKTYVRLDTGEQVKMEPIGAEERQGELTI